MPHETPVTPRSRRWVTVRGAVAQILLVWVLYTASIGPMYWKWYAATYINGPYWVAAMYSPLHYACRYVPYYADAVEGYIWWWNFPAPGQLGVPDPQLVADQAGPVQTPRTN